MGVSVSIYNGGVYDYNTIFITKFTKIKYHKDIEHVLSLNSYHSKLSQITLITINNN